MIKPFILISSYLLLIVCTSSAAPTVVLPPNGENLTDYAVSFQVKTNGEPPYTLEASKRQNFSSGVVRQTQTLKHSDNSVFFFTNHGEIRSDRRFFLSPGTWYWRVKDNTGTSSVRRIVVNNVRSSRPVVRPISHVNPLWHIRVGSQIRRESNPAQRLRRMIPDDIKENVVLDLETSFKVYRRSESIYDYCRFFDNLGYKFLVELGDSNRSGRAVILSELERVFKDMPNCVGATTTELFYGYFINDDERSQLDGTLELCKKYGKIFSYADMNWRNAAWQVFNHQRYERFKSRGFAQNFVPMYKTTEPLSTFTAVGAIQGMYMTGMVRNIGIWADSFAWEDFGLVGQFDKDLEPTSTSREVDSHQYFPYIQNIKYFIYGMTYGSTAFGLESLQTWNRVNGDLTDHHSRYFHPFIRAVTKETIVPPRHSIRQNFKAIVDTEFRSGDRTQTPILTNRNGNIWGDFQRSTFGITSARVYSKIFSHRAYGDVFLSTWLEVLPNTDRYPSGIPFLPKPGVAAPKVQGRALPIIKISDLNTRAKVNNRLNTFYPASTNQAYARKINRSLFVFNTRENQNYLQSYRVNVNTGKVRALSGKIRLLNYVIGKCRPDGSVFIQTNGYVRKPNLSGGTYNLGNHKSNLNFHCSSRPSLTALYGEGGAITQSWDASSKILTVVVNHTNAGAVDFVLR